ncbi:TPA: hypothetical protein PXL93_002772 [Yersinia enterocolitica]|nr:hypothetical protein [Yersinia enterocolitica]
MQKIGDIPNTRADSHGEFTDGNVAGGVPPTILPAEWFNTIQRELMSVLSAADIDADSAQFTQVATAISKLISNGIDNSDFLQAANHLKEIKNAGPTAVAETLANLGLGDVAHLPQLTGIVGASRNAKMSIPAASTTATFTADEIIVQTALGGEQYKLSNFNKIINLATSGAGGMDMGTVPVIGFIALYAIYNPTTHVSALLAVNATSAAAPEICAGVMPPNYAASALVGVQPIEAGKFKVCLLTGRHVSFPRLIAITTSSSTSNTAVRLSISAITPKNALKIAGVIQAGGGSTITSYSSLQVGSDSNMCGGQEVRLGVQAGTGSDVVGNFMIYLNDPQALYYIHNTTMNSSTVCTIFISSYSF